MKKVFFNIISVLALIALVVSCEKTPVEQANDEYDYNKIFPVVRQIDGPAEVIATGLQFMNYSVPSRGGSTFAWTVDKVGATIEVDPKKPFMAKIKYDQQPLDTAAVIRVVETTHAGLVSEPKTKNIVLKRYCPIDMDLFTGNYKEEDGDGQDCPVTVTRDPADDLFGLKLDGILGQAYRWGPPGGKLTIKIEGCDNTLFFDKQITGIVSATYGDVSMELLDGAKGWIDPDDYSFGYQGKVTVAAGSFGDYPFVYTKL